MNTQISFVHRPPALLYAALQRATDPKINRVLHSHNNVCVLIYT